MKIKNKGITLISLVITIIVLLILAGVTIATLTGDSGILGKGKKADEETRKKAATEILNLKITHVQMETYTKEQRLPILKELAKSLAPENDNEIKSLTMESTKKTSSLGKNWIDDEKYSSIFTILKDYPEYEFEIDSSLKLATINGIEIADNADSQEVETLKTTVAQLQSRIEKLEQEKDYSTLNQEKLIGKWYDGSNMYELSLPITIPTTNKEGTNEWKKIDLQKYNIKECNIVEGYFYLDKEKTSFPFPWTAANSTLVRIAYYGEDYTLRISNGSVSYNGNNGYVTIHYNKNN